MKNNFFFILFIFIFSFANSQTNLDSLYSVWQDKTQADSTRVAAFKDYIWDGYLFSQPDSAMVLADRLYKFSTEKSYKKGIALGIHTKGVVHYLQGDYIKALDYYHKSLKIKEEIGDKKGIANSLNNIGGIYQVQGEFLKALDYSQKSIKIREEIGDIKSIGRTLNNIGSMYLDQGDYIKALDYFQKSLKINEQFGNKLDVATSLNLIGLIYMDTEDLNNALSYFQKSLKINEEIKNKWKIATIIGNIGLVYERQENYINALDFYQKSLKIGEEISDKQRISLMLNNIGAVYEKQGEYDKAMVYYQKGVKVSKENEDNKKLVRLMSNIGSIYFKQGAYHKAIEQCNKTLVLNEKIGYLSLQEKNCECLYNSYKALGNGNKALKYHEQMLVLNDSLQSEETAKKLQQMEFSKQVLADSLVQVEKDLKVEMVHQTEVRKKDKNKNIALGAGIFFLLLSGGFYGRWRYVKKSKAIIEKEKDRSENLLLNILPFEIAEELKLKGSADARDFDLVSVIFTDFKGFTKASEKLTAKALIAEINHCFMAFDHICEKYGIEKIKTIGDAYMAVGGLPIPSDDSVKQTILAALEMQSFITERIAEKLAKNEVPFEMRLGINTGPVVAGIVGVKKFQYDIWGDTVNTAARMESSGEIGKVNISKDTYMHIKDDPEFSFVSRGKVQAKSKGEIEMFFVTKQPN